MARFRPRLRRTNANRSMTTSPSSLQKSATRRSRFRRLFPRLLPFDGFRKSRAVERLVSWFKTPSYSSRSYAMARPLGRWSQLGGIEGLEDRVLLASDVFINTGITTGMDVTIGPNTVTYSPTTGLNQVNNAEVANFLANGFNVIIDNDSGQAETGIIEVQDPIAFTFNSPIPNNNVFLTLDATDGINGGVEVNANIDANGNGTLTLNLFGDNNGVIIDTALVDTNGGDFNADTNATVFLNNASQILTRTGAYMVNADNNNNGGDYDHNTAAFVNTAGGDVVIEAETLILDGGIDAVSGMITLINSTDSTIGVGDNAAGTFNISEQELHLLNTTGMVLIGRQGVDNEDVELGDADLTGELFSKVAIYGDNSALNVGGNSDFNVVGFFTMPDNSRLEIHHADGDVEDEEEADPTVPNIVIGGASGEMLILARNIGTTGGEVVLDISVARLDVNATGDVDIDNTGGLTLVDLNGSTGLTAGGFFNVAAESPLTVASPVSAVGDVTLTSVDDTVVPDDDMNINANITSSTGSIFLNAGDGLFVTSGVTISAVLGDITANIDFGNADAGAGETFSSIGATYIVGPTNVLSINGNTDNDTINLTGPFAMTNGGRIEIDGGGGTDTISVTDVDVTMANVGPALTISDADTVNIHGPGGGTSDYNSTAASGILLDDVGNVDIERVTSNNNAVDGLRIETAVNNLTIDDSQFNNNVNDGINLFVAANDVTFTNVEASGNDPGVFIPGAASFSDTGGMYVGNDDGGIVLQDITGDVTLTNTTANNNDADANSAGDGVSISDNGSGAAIGGNLTIMGGSFSDTDAAGATEHQVAGLRVVGDITGNVSVTGGSAFDGNDAFGLALNGGVVSGGSGVMIDSASFDNNDGVGFQFFNGDAVSISITNSTASGNTGGGTATDAGVLVSGGTLFSGTFTANNLVADNNTSDVAGNGNGHGLRIDGAPAGSVDITGGSFSGNNAAGVKLTDVAGNVTLNGTTASGNGDEGIDIDQVGGTTMLTGVIVDGNTKDGLEVTNAGAVTINGPSSFSGNTGDGIEMTTVGVVILSGVTADGNTKDGLETSDTLAVTVSNSSFSGNTGAGMDIANTNGADVDISQVTADTNTLTGMQIGLVGNVDIADSSASDNGGDGINVSNAADVMLDTVMANGNGGDGVEVTSSANVTFVDVTANDNDPGVNVIGVDSFSDTDGTYNNNTNSGVQLVSVTGAVTLDGTEASSNGSHGISMDTVGGAVTATDVTADSNDLAGLVVDMAASVSVSGGSYSDNNIGILADDVTGLVTISGATINDNTTDGVDTNGQDVILDGNTFDGNATDVDANAGEVLIQNNVFGGASTIGVLIRGDAIVDLGQDAGDPQSPTTDPTGLGTSAGMNDFTGFTSTATSTSGAIVVENLEAVVGPTYNFPTDIAAFSNSFTGDPELRMWHDYDDNALAFINVSDVAELEIIDTAVAEDAGSITVTVRLNITAPGVPFIVPFSTTVTLTDGSADSVLDYTNNSPITLNFPGTAGMVVDGDTATFMIPIIVDNIVEFDETIDVSLSNTTHPAVDETDTGTITITNDDFATVTITNNVSLLEGSGGGTTAFDFNINLSNPVQDLLEVEYDITDFTTDEAPGGFNGDDDYDAPASPFNFGGADPLGGNYTLTILVAADDVVEGDEEFLLNLLNMFGASTANTAAITVNTVTRFGDVVNDDVTDITISDLTVSPEGDGNTLTNYNFVVTSSHAVQPHPTPGGPAFFQPFNPLVHITTETADVSQLTTSPLTFVGNAGETQNITVRVLQDELVEFDETFSITLGVPIVPQGSGVNPVDIDVVDGLGEGTIIDDDSATVIINNVSLDEGTPDPMTGLPATTPFNFSVMLQGDTVEDAFDVVVNTAEFPAPMEATSGVDFTPLTNFIVSFPAGSAAGSMQQVAVDVITDDIAEDDEQFDVVLTDPYTAADEPDINVNNVGGVGTIANDDGVVISIVPDVSISEGDAGTTNFVFTVTLSNPLEVPLEVHFSQNNLTATAGDFAGGGTASPITFAPGSVSETITVVVSGDLNIEADETFEITIDSFAIPNPPGPMGINPGDIVIGAADTGVGTILNDDTATIRVLDAATMMNSNISMTETTTTYMYVVKYEGDPIPTGADVDADTANDTAVAPGDYVSESDSFSFTGPGMFAFNVDINSDAIVEANEMFDILLSNLMSVNNGAITLVDGTGTIVDDDQLLVEFTNAATSSTEGQINPQRPAIVVKGQSEISVGVQVVQTGGNASAADANLPVTVSIPPNTYDGMSAGSIFTVPLNITNDSLVEGTETIEMGLVPQDGPNGPPADAVVGDANMNAATQGSHTHTIFDNDNYTVTAMVNGQQNVTINEGGKVTLTGTIFNLAQDHVITVQWGDGASDMLTVDQADFSGDQADYMLMHTYLDDVPTVSPTDTYNLVISVTSESNQQQIVGPAPQVTVNNVAPTFTSLNVTPTSGNLGQQVTVSGTYSDPGILDTFQLLIDTNNDGVFDITTPVSNGNIPPQFFTVNQATSAFRFRITDDDSGVQTQIVPVNFQGPAPPQTAVTNSQVFYNNSAFDGGSTAANVADLNAVDTSKSALGIGQAATFANITGARDGITGVAFTVNTLPSDGAGLSPADFQVRMGATNNINSWAAGPSPTVTVLANSGPGGADMVLLTFPAGSIADTYGAFQMLATANTGLAGTHTAIFGNVRGDTGAAFVGQGSFFGRDAADLQAMVPALFQPAGVTSATDVTKDATTNAFDLQVIPVQSTLAIGGAFQSNVLPVITPGFSAVPAPGFAAAAADEAVADDDAPVTDGNGAVGASQDGRVGATEDDDRDLAFATFGDSDDADSDLIGALATGRMSL